MLSVVLDTNVFVAAGFRPRSTAAKILSLVRKRQLRMVWNEPSRRETEFILNKIPPLSWHDVADLFEEPNRCDAQTDLVAFECIPDRDDRKYAALSAASDAVLISNDRHLIDHRDRLHITVQTPGEFWRDRFGPASREL